MEGVILVGVIFGSLTLWANLEWTWKGCAIVLAGVVAFWLGRGL